MENTILAIAIAGLVICVAVLIRPWVVLYIVDRWPHRVMFHYISYAVSPDMVELWVGGLRVYAYAWISGVSAHRLSILGRIHAVYEEHSRELQEIQS